MKAPIQLRNDPLLLKGAPGSPYTRKMLAILRYRHIPYSLLVAGSTRLEGMPKPKVELLPTFYLPNDSGKLEAVTDSTPLLRRFESLYPGPKVQPADLVLRFIDSLLEDYADEWLTKCMFHYRWHFAEDIAKSGNILPRWRNFMASDDLAAEQERQFSDRQTNRLHFVGSNESTWGVIEQSYKNFLDVMEAHLKQYPFLMGSRPGAADFASYGQLTQLAYFDPTPSAITLQFAPRVYAWVALMEDLSGLAPKETDWLTWENLPESLLCILNEAARTYQPVMLANARALIANQDTVRTIIDDKPWIQNTFTYQGKCLRWLREEYASLSSSDRAAVNDILEQTSLTALIHEPL
ncbi:MAG: glutathione S-transferase N-terminal domain-containing protein [Burkholderiaceae bacterium]